MYDLSKTRRHVRFFKYGNMHRKYVRHGTAQQFNLFNLFQPAVNLFQPAVDWVRLPVQ